MATKARKPLDKAYPFVSGVVPTAKFVGRKKEVEELRETLCKKRMRNAILVGPAGCGKTELVAAVAGKVKKYYRFYALSVAGCVAGMGNVGDFELRLTSLLRDAGRESELDGIRIVLFVDEIHTIMGAGAAVADGHVVGADFSNIVKPYLSSGKITMWGATTPREYRKYMKADAALMRRLSPVYVGEMGEADTALAVRNFTDGKLGAPLLKLIYVESSAAGWSAQPDASIELADRCMARAACTKKEVDAAMVRQIAASMAEEGALLLKEDEENEGD